MSHKKTHTQEVSRKDFIKVLKRYKNEVSQSEESSRNFLVELGVLTKKGNLRKNYKNLCIPVEQE